MEKPVKLSVIMACLNGADTIATQLDALAQQQWSEPWELIIADNGSTDNTLAIVGRYQERIPHLRVIDASAKRGHCVTSESAVVVYKCTDFYAPQDEAGVLWNDPDLGIEWPVHSPNLSDKDRGYPRLGQIPSERLPEYTCRRTPANTVTANSVLSNAKR